MKHRERYTPRVYATETIQRWRREFFKRTGPALKLLMDLFANAPGIALTIKDARGRIMHTNRFNAQISGWPSPETMIGYTSEELYPPDLAAVYGGRDREVMETGEPIVERVYGFVADRSTALNCVTVRPVEDARGRRIGTATVYWRADRKLNAAGWYDPMRKAIVYLNDHSHERITVERLAETAHYSVAQFRRLFAKLTQMSPATYIAHLRVNAAKTLLTTTDMRITEIAVETGFYDHSHLTRTFREFVGCTPNAFRKREISHTWEERPPHSGRAGGMTTRGKNVV